MAKYNYDKKALKGLSVAPFLGEVKVREQEIERASDTLPEFNYNANNLAAKLHPHVQFGVITKVSEQPGGKVFVIAPDERKGCKELAYFRAGQYISVALTIGNTKLNKPYSLCSDPSCALGALGNKYTLAIKKSDNGFASKYILENWKIGTELIFSAPLGEFYYTKLRDARHVVAVAGGSGITPFLAMAKAIASGVEDFNLTILYGSRTASSIMLKSDLETAAAASNGKVRIVHVLSDEIANGYEYGYVTAEIIKKYAGTDDYSLFVCGPKALYSFMQGEVEKLALPRRRVRYELSGEFGNPAADPSYNKAYLGKTFRISVFVRGNKTELLCRADQSLMSAIEAAGIRVPSDCRSGSCGWCHSRLIYGDVFVPASADGRRAADKKFGWIHPCTTYPLSDIALEVFPLPE